MKKRVKKVAASKLPTPYGVFDILVYASSSGREHTVLLKGTPTSNAFVRLHSKCLTGDTFFSLRCDCREQLEQSLKIVSKAKNGAVLYLDQEGRGIGLSNKIKAYALQDRGHDTVEANHALGLPADARDYEEAALILKDLGMKKIKLLTNNPDKEKQLQKHGIEITSRVPIESKPHKRNKQYLTTKKQKLGHKFGKV
jgi:GTP cyclohydrolase II